MEHMEPKRMKVLVDKFTTCRVGGGLRESGNSCRKKISSKQSIYIYALLISMAFTLQKKIIYTGKISDSYSVNYINDIDGITLISVFFYAIPIAISLFLLIFLIEQICKFIGEISKKTDILQRINFRILSFIILLAGWSIYFITYFPGTAVSDSVRVLNNPIGTATQHTLFYNLLLTGIFKLGTWIAFGNMYGGAILYSIVQMIYTACIISYVLDWMSKRNISRLVILFVLAFYALSPMMSNIAILAVKDSFYSVTFLLYIPLLTDIYDSKAMILQESKKKVILFIYVTAILTLTRNNGKYITVVLITVLFTAYRNTWKCILLIALLGIVIPIMSDSMAMNYFDKQKDFVESMALPLQQIAMTVVSDGEMNEKQKAVVDNIMSKENFEKYYAPCSVDSIKWGEGGKNLNKYYIRSNKLTFLATWISMFPENVQCYIKAFLLNAYGYWGFNVESTQGYYSSYIDVGNDIHIEHMQIWPDRIEKELNEYYSKFKNRYSAGEMIWIILFLLVLEMSKKGRWIIFIPSIFCWIILIMSAPITNGFRYVYPLYLSIPLLCCITLFDRTVEMIRAKE